jgi:hypothetical protein
LKSAESQQNGDFALILPIISHFAAGQNLTGKITGQNDSFCSFLNLEFCTPSGMVNFQVSEIQSKCIILLLFCSPQIK